MKKGFTLIELLVVISIIGLLSSVVLASLVSAKKKAQNSYTIQTISEYIKALDSYYLDHGSYYVPNNFNQSACLGAIFSGSICGGGNAPFDDNFRLSLVTYFPNGLPNPSPVKNENGNSGGYYWISGDLVGIVWSKYTSQLCGIANAVSYDGGYTCNLYINSNQLF